MDMTPAATTSAEPPVSPVSADVLLRHWARETPHARAFADPRDRAAALGLGNPRELSFAAAEAIVARLAATFGRFGLDPGDVIALQVPNTVEGALVMLAGWRAGLIVCPLSLLWRYAEIDHAFVQVNPRAVVTVAALDGVAHAETICQAAVDHLSIRFVFGFGPDLPDGVTPIDEWLSDDGPAHTRPSQHQPQADQPALMTWSAAPSGPFPVPRTHRELLALGQVFVDELRLTPRDTLLNAFPSATIVGVGGHLIPSLMAGARLLLHQPFDLDLFLAQLSDHAVTYTAVPAPVMDALEQVGGLATHGRRLARIGCVWPAPSAGLRPKVAELPLPIYDLHNLSEVGVALRRRALGQDPTVLPLGPVRISGSQGDDAVYLETALDPTTRALRLRGAVVPHGPLAPAGPQAESLLRLDAEGYVASFLSGRTVGAAGDRFRCDRSDDLIHHGGMTVSAVELDRLYAGHPDFYDVAAFAIEDPVMGERIVAAVVPQPQAGLSLDGFRNYLTDKQIAPYKLPDRLLVVSTIPRRSDGSVARDQILHHVAA